MFPAKVIRHQVEWVEDGFETGADVREFVSWRRFPSPCYV